MLFPPAARLGRREEAWALRAPRDRSGSGYHRALGDSDESVVKLQGTSSFPPPLYVHTRLNPLESR